MKSWITWLESVWRGLQPNRLQRMANLPGARPRLEVLEDRYLLDTYLWVATSNNANWNDTGVFRNVDSGVVGTPGGQDKAWFNTALSVTHNGETFQGSNKNCTLNSGMGVMITELKLTENYQGHLILNGANDDLTITSSAIMNGYATVEGAAGSTHPFQLR